MVRLPSERSKLPKRKNPTRKRQPIGIKNPKKQSQIIREARPTFKIDLMISEEMGEGSVWDIEFPFITPEGTKIIDTKVLVTDETDKYGEIEFEILESNDNETFSIGDKMTLAVGEDSVDDVYSLERDKNIEKQIKKDKQRVKLDCINDRLRKVENEFDSLKNQRNVGFYKKQQLKAELLRLQMKKQSIKSGKPYEVIEDGTITKEKLRNPESMESSYYEYYSQKINKVTMIKDLTESAIKRLNIPKKDWFLKPIDERQHIIKEQFSIMKDEGKLPERIEKETEFDWEEKEKRQFRG